MSLSDFEIKKITEIVAGKVGGKLDAKELRKVIDSVVDNLQQANPEIEGATCEGSQTPLDNQESRSGSEATTEKPDIITDTNNEAGLYQQIESTDKSRIIIAAFGKDRPGVVAAITKVLSEMNCSIEDISQTLMQEFFSMIMVVNISASTAEFSDIRDNIKATETELGMKVYIMHEDIFRYMHRI